MTGSPSSALFGTVLVANRGEIAVRVQRTLRRLGIRSAAVFSDADAGAQHVAEADVAVRIGPAPARQSYLDVEAVVAAALRVGADAVHPGYGFLSENAAFAQACAEAGIVFLGPPVHALEVMGDKASAKRAAVAAGVPVVPGVDGTGMADDEIVDAATALGLPVLIKPSAGGGGKGMRLVRDAADLAAAVVSARREARSSFGDDTLLVERFVTDPRHIEVQVFGDAHGTVLHLGERECSLQRRHQKVVEEAPSVLVDTATRHAMGTAAVAAARAVGYVGAGTVEFVVPSADPSAFAFLEMNTRLQVEHPVTEMVTGLDLVELQLRVGAGHPLGLTQDEVVLTGHAVEARVYAEDPAAGFLPTGGPVLAVHEPRGAGIRVDSGVRAGSVVGSDYDPMLAKVVAHGPDRATALARLDRALAQTAVLGLTTNVPFLRALVADPDVLAGRLDTGLIERSLDHLITTAAPPDLLVAAALALLSPTAGTAGTGPWDTADGWRAGEPAPLRLLLSVGGAAAVEVLVRRPGRTQVATVQVAGADPVPASAVAGSDGDGDGGQGGQGGHGDLTVTVDGCAQRWRVARGADALWLARDGGAWAVTEVAAGSAGAAGASAAEGALRSPMPGTVVAVPVAVGTAVAAGAAVVVVEAMKMEHTLTAPFAGRVAELAVAVGDRVGLGDVLATVEEEAP